jgi:hypothetical protein
MIRLALAALAVAIVLRDPHPALPDHLRNLNPANPSDRAIIEDERERNQEKLARAQHLVDTDPHTHGFRHSQALINRRDLLDAIDTALFGLLHSMDDVGSLQLCRSYTCRSYALPTYVGSGFCESCLHHAIEGTAPPIDPTALPEPYIGPVFGR